MPSAEQIRETIRAELKRRGLGSIAIVEQMKRLGLTSVNRTYLSEFLRRKKNSLSFDFSQEFADFLQIEVQALRISRSAPAVIRKGTKPHFYITEHMQARGWDDEVLAGRMDSDPATVRKWRRNPQDWQLPAFLHAFGLEDAADLARPPVHRTPAETNKARRHRA